MKTKTMRILIIDDEDLAIRRLQNLLKNRKDIEIVGTAGTAESGKTKIISLKPDIVLIDVEIGNSTGYEVIREVDKTGFRPKYIVVTAFSQYAINGIRTRVDDYLLKPIDLADLKAALERVIHDPLDAGKVDNLANKYGLTERECQVLSGILAGKISRQIAEELNLSKHTIDTFRRKILKKTGTHSTLELIRKNI